MNIHEVDYESEVLEKLDDIVEILKDREESSGDTVYKIETTDRDKYYMAFHGDDFYFTLWDLDQDLRSKIKYGENYTEEQIDAFQLVRDKLNDLMDEHGVDFNHVR